MREANLYHAVVSPIPHGDLLIAAPRRWDEATFAVPAIRALAASGLTLGILCEEKQVAFWETIPGLAVLPFPEKAKVKVIAANLVGKWAASLAWEAGFEAEVFEKAAILRRLGGSEKALAKRLTHPLALVVSPLDHRVQFYLGAAKAMGIATEQPEFFAPAPLTTGKTPSCILICPDSDFGAHYEWPLERWEEIARACIERRIPVVVGALTHGRGLGKSLAANLGEGTPIVEFGEFGAELSLIAAYPSILCADGSLPHLASHVGATCAILYGPNDPAWKRPLGKRHRMIRRHVECAPCLLEKCAMDLRCQKELTVERVLQGMFS